MEKTTCFWSWNSHITKDEISLQMQEFHNKGYGGILIHSRCGLRIPYMGEAWFARYEQAMELAASYGMDAYIYDEDGWPSGYAGGIVPAVGEDLWFKALRYGSERPEKYPVLAAFCCDGEEYLPMSTERSDADLYFWYIPDRHYVDWLNPHTASNFLSSTYEVYKKKLGKWFGKVIKGFFTDEPQLSVGGWPWSPYLADAYEKQYGESLVSQLWRLIVPTETAFRRRFWLMVNEQMKTCFTIPLQSWCRENGLELTGHFAAEDGLCNQLSANGGLLAHYKEMGLPGIDYLGNRHPTPLLMKQPASIAAQFKDGRVISECFGCSGWAVRFEELLYNWGWQSALGVTRPCLHLAAYTIAGRRKRDYPAFFSYQEPWWEQFPSLLEHIDGLNALMTEGEREVQTVVISPLCGAMEVYEDETCRRDRLRHITASYRQLLENLLDIQLDYELTDETILRAHGRVEGGRLHIGKRAYTCVYVAEGANIDDGIADLLAEFVRGGGCLRCVGDASPSLRAVLEDCTIVMNRRALLEKEVRCRGWERPVRLLDDRGQTAGDAVLHVRRIGEIRRIHILNRQDGYRKAMLRLEGSFGATMVDISTGKHTPLPAMPGQDGGCYVPLTLYPKQSVVVETTLAPQPAALPVLRRTEALEALPVLTEPNSFTIDHAAYRVDGGEYSPEMDVIRVAEELYSASCSRERVLQVRYRFTCAQIFADAEIAMEDMGCESVTFNGHPLTQRSGWWIDRQLGTFSVAEWLQEGENELVATYRVPPYEDTFSIAEIFETERNRFCYPIEPEAVYVRGDFAVEPVGGVVHEPRGYHVEDAGFRLTPSVPLTYGDLTPQGLWFYRGNVQYTVTLVKKPGERVFLRVPDYHGTLVRWQTGGQEGVIVTGDRATELTEALVIGENMVTVTLYGSNRNLMGPHHHINDECGFVGPDTFFGRYGWEDFVSPHITGEDTYRNRYACLPLGILRMQAEFYTE